jgi:transcriptional regulator with XRE-family HTH domain
MSLGDLAEATGVAKSYISKLEKGESLNLGLATLAAVAKALDHTVHGLLPQAGAQQATGSQATRGEVVFETISDTIPEPLQSFLDEEERTNGPVPEDARRALAVLKLRGRRPESKEDYRLLYQLLRRLTS